MFASRPWLMAVRVVILLSGGRATMGVFKKQGVYWIDYYVTGHRKRERIGPYRRLAETVLRKRKVEIAEGKFSEKRWIKYRCRETYYLERELSGTPWMFTTEVLETAPQIP